MLDFRDERLDELEADMDIAISHIAALRAMVIALIYELGEHTSDLPARLAQVLKELDAPAIRAAGGTRAEINACETECLADQIQAFAL